MNDASETVMWRAFLRAMVDQIDGDSGVPARDALLRGIGRRMAATNPLPLATDTQALTMEMNDRLAGWHWGGVKLHLSDTERVLVITHTGLPWIGGTGEPPGTWLAAVLEGLYETWLNALPNADQSLTTRRFRTTSEYVVLKYGQA